MTVVVTLTMTIVVTVTIQQCDCSSDNDNIVGMFITSNLCKSIYRMGILFRGFKFSWFLKPRQIRGFIFSWLVTNGGVFRM